MVQTADGVSVRAVVERVCRDGANPYVVTRPRSYELIPEVPKNSTITFSLDTGVWKEKKDPEKGQVVILEDIQEFSRGWRAFSARASK